MSGFLTFLDQGEDLGSWLIVLAAGSYIVKVRATYERPEEEATASLRLRRSFDAIESILQSIQREAPVSEPNKPLQPTRAARPKEQLDASGGRPARLNGGVRRRRIQKEHLPLCGSCCC